MTAHEAVVQGGFGAELAAVVQHGAFDYLDAPIERVGAKFAPLAFAPVMEDYIIPHASGRAGCDQEDAREGLSGWRPRSSCRVWARAWSRARSCAWLKAEGETVKKREPLYELDTDKVTQEVEAEADGVLLKILVNEGEVEVGSTIAVIGKEGEEVSLEAVAAPPAATVEERGGDRRGADPAPEPPTASPRTSRPPQGAAARRADVKASPLARRIARERGLDLAAIAGTGPEGGSSPRTSSTPPRRPQSPASRRHRRQRWRSCS